MFKVHLFQFGDTKDPHLKALEAEYEKRLQPFCQLQTHRLKSLDQLREKPGVPLVVLDETGQEFTSQEFAKFLEKTRDFHSGEIQFLIGDTNGLPEDIKAKAEHLLALSKMTFTHDMVRLFLKEQLYRAFMILAGRTYHK